MYLPFEFDFHTIEAAPVVHFVFLLIVVLVGVISVVQFFHWRKYGLLGTAFAMMEVLYFLVCAILLSIAFFSIN